MKMKRSALYDLILLLGSLLCVRASYPQQSAYPLTTLRCYSTFTKPDGQLICPEARSKYCVKEISNLRQDLCGHTQYFGDTYMNNLCILRKCSDECKDEIYKFTYGTLEYTRTRTCCSTDYCNGSSKTKSSSNLLTIVCTLLLSTVLLLNS